MNSINPMDYVEAAKVLGVVLMVLGGGLFLLAIRLIFKKRPECGCDE